MARPRCAERDAVVYFTFWPIFAFSLFVASAELAFPSPVESFPALFVGPLFVFKECTRMFAIASMALSALDVWIHYTRDPKHLCTRGIACEVNAVLALLSFLVVTFVHAFASYVEEDAAAAPSRIALLLYRLVPWSLITFALMLELAVSASK